MFPFKIKKFLVEQALIGILRIYLTFNFKKVRSSLWLNVQEISSLINSQTSLANTFSAELFPSLW